MIVDAIIGWIVGLVRWVVDLLPDSHIQLPDTVQAFVHMGDLGYFLPIPELVASVLAVYALGPPMFLTSVIAWLTVGVVRGGNPKM